MLLVRWVSEPLPPLPFVHSVWVSWHPVLGLHLLPHQWDQARPCPMALPDAWRGPRCSTAVTGESRHWEREGRAAAFHRAGHKHDVWGELECNHQAAGSHLNAAKCLLTLCPGTPACTLSLPRISERQFPACFLLCRATAFSPQELHFYMQCLLNVQSYS